VGAGRPELRLSLPLRPGARQHMAESEMDEGTCMTRLGVPCEEPA
jgi:hypothetical protein